MPSQRNLARRSGDLTAMQDPTVGLADGGIPQRSFEANKGGEEAIYLYRHPRRGV
jgi:hypothetical protein